MEYKCKITILFVLLFNIGWNSGSDCGTKDLDKLFENGVSQCDIHEPWTYSEDSVGRDGGVTKFMTPNSRSSCVTSHILPMAEEDIIEVNVYTKSIVKEDYVTLVVYETAENKVIGEATLSKEENNVVNGRNILKITIGGRGNFNGYIMLTGAVSTGSVLRVESVCHRSVLDEKTEEVKLVKLTSNYRAPDIYIRQADSILEELVHPNANIIQNRALRFIDFEDFWTPLTITLAVVIPVVILILIGWGCYALGKKSGTKQEPDIIYEDVNNLPKPYLVPRVKSAYTESVAGTSFGGRNNNIYSV